MAKAMAQHFMDARLIENAIDRSSNTFKDKGIYILTPKGLHVLERFISKNGMSLKLSDSLTERHPEVSEDELRKFTKLSKDSEKCRSESRCNDAKLREPCLP